jgi:pyruvate/2-oxoglutarate dehydrogenase complex dihydrolipoamide acyltransferase (E2) component
MSMDIELPKWGMTMQEATIVEWLVQPGDTITEGQEIAVVMTNKVEASVEAPADGTLAEILVDADETVDVGTVIARLE